MTTQTLDSFLEEAKEGTEFKEKLKNGKIVSIWAKAPTEGDAFEIRKILQDVISANRLITDGAIEGSKVEIDDPGVFIRLRELDSKCLIACVDELTPENVMGLLAQLKPDSYLLNHVKSLCGVDMFQRIEGEEGAEEEGK